MTFWEHIFIETTSYLTICLRIWKKNLNLQWNNSEIIIIGIFMTKNGSETYKDNESENESDNESFKESYNESYNESENESKMKAKNV